MAFRLKNLSKLEFPSKHNEFHSFALSESGDAESSPLDIKAGTNKHAVLVLDIALDLFE